MSAVYRALLAEGDRYLEEAQGFLDGPTKEPARAAAHAALASALYARAALEKPDLLSKLAAMKPPTITATQVPDAPATRGERAASIDRHPAGKKRVPRRTPGAAK